MAKEVGRWRVPRAGVGSALIRDTTGDEYDSIAGEGRGHSESRGWWPGASSRRGAERPTQECGSENGTWGVGGEQLGRREEPGRGTCQRQRGWRDGSRLGRGAAAGIRAGAGVEGDRRAAASALGVPPATVYGGNQVCLLSDVIHRHSLPFVTVPSRHP